MAEVLEAARALLLPPKLGTNSLALGLKVKAFALGFSVDFTAFSATLDSAVSFFSDPSASSFSGFFSSFGASCTGAGCLW